LKLIVVDVAALGDYDPLPVPGDMEAAMIEEVTRMLVPRGQSDKVVDSHTDNAVAQNR